MAKIRLPYKKFNSPVKLFLVYPSSSGWKIKNQLTATITIQQNVSWWQSKVHKGNNTTGRNHSMEIRLLWISAARSLDDNVCCIRASSHTFFNGLLLNQLWKKSSNKCISYREKIKGMKLNPHLVWHLPMKHIRALKIINNVMIFPCW